MLRRTYTPTRTPAAADAAPTKSYKPHCQKLSALKFVGVNLFGAPSAAKRASTKRAQKISEERAAINGGNLDR